MKGESSWGVRVRASYNLRSKPLDGGRVRKKRGKSGRPRPPPCRTRERHSVAREEGDD